MDQVNNPQAPVVVKIGGRDAHSVALLIPWYITCVVDIDDSISCIIRIGEPLRCCVGAVEPPYITWVLPVKKY